MYKAFKHLLVMFCLALPQAAAAQGDMARTMVNCFEAQDINRLAENFAPEMEISILGDGNLLNATEAKMKIYDFVTGKGTLSCSITHNGDRETSGFCILSLRSADGGTYRLYSFYRKDGNGEMKIHQLRIDHD